MLIQHTNITIKCDSELQLLEASDSLSEWTSSHLRIGHSLSEVLCADLFLQLREHIRKAMNGHYTECTVKVKSADSTSNPIQSITKYRVHIASEQEVNGKVLQLTAAPFSALEANTRLSHANEFLQITLDTIDQGVTIYDNDLRLVAWNTVYEKMGIFPPEIIKHNLSLEHAYRLIAESGVLGEGDPATLAEAHVNSIRTMDMVAEEELYPPTGKVIKIHRYYLPDGGMCATFTDITKQKDYENLLIKQANTDQLTQIANRYSILKQLETEVADQKNTSAFYLMYIDLDRFKLINDAYGHVVGDKLLVKTVTFIRGLINENEGDCIGRIGGDEFIIILKSAPNITAVNTLCRNILTMQDTTFKLSDVTLFASCSIGISHYPEQGRSSGELVTKADAAMYHAKLQGKNNFQHYHDSFKERTTKRTLIANTLRKQIREDISQLFLMFQPIIELRTGKMIAAEALLRWTDLQRYNITVDELISIIEEHGMIMDVGNHVIDLSLKGLSKLFHKRHLDNFSLSINASPTQIAQKGFSELFIKQYTPYLLPPEATTLEITESALMNNTDIVHENLLQIREAGFNLAIDDFGTGYSSLSYLEKYPFTHLKIDKSFIDHIPENKVKTHLLAAIIDIAKAFNMKVIAEGIEKKQQLDYLLENDCHYGQGYYFSRPITLSHLKENFLC